jgi:hypothetical protein
MVANIMRLVADAMAPGTLAAQSLIRARLLDWLRDTTLYLRSLAPFGEAFWEVSQVCICSRSRVAVIRYGTSFEQTRRQLYLCTLPFGVCWAMKEASEVPKRLL